jgi:hypothetical protein
MSTIIRICRWYWRVFCSLLRFCLIELNYLWYCKFSIKVSICWFDWYAIVIITHNHRGDDVFIVCCQCWMYAYFYWSEFCFCIILLSVLNRHSCQRVSCMFLFYALGDDELMRFSIITIIIVEMMCSWFVVSVECILCTYIVPICVFGVWWHPNLHSLE